MCTFNFLAPSLWNSDIGQNCGGWTELTLPPFHIMSFSLADERWPLLPSLDELQGHGSNQLGVSGVRVEKVEAKGYQTVLMTELQALWPPEVALCMWWLWE